MAKEVQATICPVCGLMKTMRRGQTPEDCDYFDPEFPVEKSYFIQKKESLGGISGFKTTGHLTLAEAARKPEYRALLERLQARLARASAYLEEVMG